MRRIIEALDWPVWLFSDGGTVVAESQSATASMHRDAAETQDNLAQTLQRAVDSVRARDANTVDSHIDVAMGQASDRVLRVGWVDPDEPEAGILAQLVPLADADLGAVMLAGAETAEVPEDEARIRALEDELQETQQKLARFHLMADGAPGAVYERHDTIDGRWLYIYHSAGMPDLFGVTKADLEAEGRAVFRHVDPAEVREIAAEVAIAKQKNEKYERVLNVNHPRLGPRAVALSTRAYPQEDGSTVWFGNMADVTPQIAAERRAAEADEALRRAHERFLLMADSVSGAIFELRVQPDGQLIFVYFSPQLPDLLGVAADQLRARGSTVYDNVPAEQLPELEAAVRGAMTGTGPKNFRHRAIHPDHGERWIHVSLTPHGEDELGAIGFGNAMDVTDDVKREIELRRAHELAEQMRRENERLALQDGLTGLPNRRGYDREIERRAAIYRVATLVRIDLDYFKSVNDTLGHEAGDAVLQRVADVLRSCLEKKDFAARIGGDEFSILPDPGRSLDDVCAQVERIRTMLAEPFFFEGRQCRFGASFGIARTENMEADTADLPVFADAALYRAKKDGRNRLELFTPELKQSILTERELAVELHQALERDEFEPWFQPQFSAEDSRLVGVETLLRWRRADGTVMAPGSFMHVAAQLRIVPELDRIMMEKAGRAMDRWGQADIRIPKISFNVSSGRMRDPEVVALARKLAAGETRVTFELLESVLVEEESELFRFHLDAVREAGIAIEIDDFGSGHASIIGLMQIAPSALKIDRRIVQPVARNGQARNLVRAIVEIAETLGIATVAEGVETAEQAQILRDMGCNVLQGYHFARPMSEDRVIESARSWRFKAA